MITLSRWKSKELKCSITVEASIVFTMMMLILFMNMGPMFICKTSSDIIKGLDDYSKKLSYLKEIEQDENVKDVSKTIIDSFPYNIDIDLQNDNTEGILNLINTSIVSFMLLKDNDDINNPFCNIDYLYPNVFDVYDDDTGIITYDYNVSFSQPLNILNIKNIDERFVVSRRAFIGSDGNRQYNNVVASESDAYYVARDYESTGVCHKYMDCSYLEKKVLKKTYDEVKDKYDKCSFCIKDNDVSGKVLYITETGDCFHIKADCPSMTAYVRTVDKDFIEERGLRICDRCKKRINNDGGG